MSDAVSKSEQEQLVQDQTVPPAAQAAIAPTTTENAGEANPMDIDAKEKPQEGAAAPGGEADVTKDGKPADVGEKRERPEEAAPMGGKEKGAALAEKGKDTGKEAKKAKMDGAEAVDATNGPTEVAAEPVAEGAAPTNGDAAETSEKPAKRGAGRPSKGKTAAAATAEGGEPKKRGPGRPRKGTNPTKEAEEAKGNDAEPATTGTRRSTRSRG